MKPWEKDWESTAQNSTDGRSKERLEMYKRPNFYKFDLEGLLEVYMSPGVAGKGWMIEREQSELDRSRGQ